MKSADYWRQRSEAVEAQAHARAQASIALIEQWFIEAQREVQKEIESWYARFAKSEGLSLADARKLLNSRELDEFRWDVQQYIKAGSSGNPMWAKQLENASARFHVSRLEAVQLHMQQQLERLYGNQLDEMESLFRQVTGDTYTRTAFDLMQGIGVGWDITVPDEKVLDKILSTPWTTDNATFRDRCWTMKEELRAQLQKDLTQGLMTGKPPLEISKGIEKRFGVSRYKAARLVNTETTYFNAVSSQQCYKDLDVERVEIIVTLDDLTCEICGKMDGKILPMPQYEPGVTVPPYHPNCRCTTAPAIDPEFAGKRAARNEDGEVYYVPADMTYPEWREKFVEGGDKSDMMLIFSHDDTDESEEIKSGFDIEAAKEAYTESLTKMPEKNRIAIETIMLSTDYEINEELSGPFGYDYHEDKIFYNPKHPKFNGLPFNTVNTHELAHRIDARLVKSWKNDSFLSAVSSMEKVIDENPSLFIGYCTEHDDYGFLSDLLCAGCRGKHRFPYWHDSEYYENVQTQAVEAFSNLFSLEANGESENIKFLETHFPDMVKIYRELEYKI